MIGMYKNAKFLLEATPWIAPSRPWFGQKWPARDWTSSSRTRRVRRRCKGTKEGRLNYFTGVSIGCPSLPHPVYPLLYWLPRIIPALEKRLDFVQNMLVALPPCGCWLVGLCTTILVNKEPFSITTLARAEVFWSVLVLWRRHHFEGLSRGEKTDVSFYCLPFTIDTSLVGFGPIASMA